MMCKPLTVELVQHAEEKNSSFIRGSGLEQAAVGHRHCCTSADHPPLCTSPTLLRHNWHYCLGQPDELSTVRKAFCPPLPLVALCRSLLGPKTVLNVSFPHLKYFLDREERLGGAGGAACWRGGCSSARWRILAYFASTWMASSHMTGFPPGEDERVGGPRLPGSRSWEDASIRVSDQVPLERSGNFPQNYTDSSHRRDWFQVTSTHALKLACLNI